MVARSSLPSKRSYWRRACGIALVFFSRTSADYSEIMVNLFILGSHIWNIDIEWYWYIYIYIDVYIYIHWIWGGWDYCSIIYHVHHLIGIDVARCVSTIFVPEGLPRPSRYRHCCIQKQRATVEIGTTVALEFLDCGLSIRTAITITYYNLKDSFSRVSGTARPKFSSKPFLGFLLGSKWVGLLRQWTLPVACWSNIPLSKRPILKGPETAIKQLSSWTLSVDCKLSSCVDCTGISKCLNSEFSPLVLAYLFCSPLLKSIDLRTKELDSHSFTHRAASIGWPL